MRHNRNGLSLLHTVFAGDGIAKMASSCIHMTVQPAWFEQLGAGWDSSTGVICLGAGSCCWLGSFTILHVASPLFHNTTPQLPLQSWSFHGVSPAVGYPDFLNGRRLQERGRRSRSFPNWHSIRLSPKEMYKPLQNSLFYMSQPKARDTTGVQILCNLALTNKELEFHFEMPQ